MGFNLNFLKDFNTVKKTVGNAAKEVVQGKAPRDVFNFLQKVTPKVATTERNLAVSTARGIARVPETVARSSAQAGFDIAGKINPNIAVPNANSGAVTDPVRRFIYGKEPIQTYQARTAGNKKVLEKSRFRGAAAPLSFLGLAGTIAGDVLPGGGKATSTAVKSGLEQLAKATSEQEVRKIMKGTPQEIIDKVAPAITKSTDPHIIDNIIQKAYQPTVQSKIPRVTDIVSNKTIPQTVAQQNIQSPVSKVIDLLQGQPAGKNQSPIPGIQNLQSKQAQLYSQGRKAQIARSYQAAEGLTGEAALNAKLGAYKGQLPRVDATKLAQHVQSNIDEKSYVDVLNQLQNSPVFKGKEFNASTAADAWRNFYRNGRLPTPSEFKLIEQAAGSGLSDAIKTTAVDSLDTWQKVKNFAVGLLGAPKAVMASFDLSGGGRQGAVLGSRFLPEWGRAQKNSVKYFASQKAYDEGIVARAASKNASFYEKMKLNLPGAGNHEEQYASTLAENIPIAGKGVAASDRAFTGGLADLRTGAADHILQDLRDAGIDPATLSDKQFASIGKFIKTASGRGDLGALEKHAVSLGEALFSPRLWKSRLDMLNPIYYAKLDPIARKYALQSAGSFASIAATVLSLAAAAGATVETDPRSSDFLKIKIGDTRYDILGGFQQNLVLGWRELKGEKKNSVTGSISKLTSGKFGTADRLSILADFVQNKENPVLSTAQTIIKGRDKAGNPINPITEVGKLAVPLNIQDTYKTAKNTENLPEAIIKATIPGSVGVGVGTYGLKDINPTGTQQKYIDKLQSQGAPKDQIEATTRFYQTLKTKPDRNAYGDQIKKVLTNPDGSFNQAGVAQAGKIADQYNQMYKKVFDDWRKQYGKYRTDKTLVKEYKSNFITNATIERYINALTKGE